MRFLFLVLLSSLSLSASASTILRCNLGFGPISEIKIEEAAGGYVMTILDENGRTAKHPVTDAELASEDLSFDFRGSYHFFKKDGQWNYVYDGEVQVIGTADCD